MQTSVLIDKEQVIYSVRYFMTADKNISSRSLQHVLVKEIGLQFDGSPDLNMGITRALFQSSGAHPVSIDCAIYVAGFAILKGRFLSPCFDIDAFEW